MLRIDLSPMQEEMDTCLHVNDGESSMKRRMQTIVGPREAMAQWAIVVIRTEALGAMDAGCGFNADSRAVY